MSPIDYDPETGSGFILTAAHCLEGQNGNRISFTYGSYDRQTSNTAVTYYSCSHYNYNGYFIAHDLGLIRFTGQFGLNVPSKNDSVNWSWTGFFAHFFWSFTAFGVANTTKSIKEANEGDLLTFAGWGYTYDGATTIPDIANYASYYFALYKDI